MVVGGRPSAVAVRVMVPVGGSGAEDGDGVAVVELAVGGQEGIVV